jgi:hypothetical protein
MATSTGQIPFLPQPDGRPRDESLRQLPADKCAAGTFTPRAGEFELRQCPPRTAKRLAGLAEMGALAANGRIRAGPPGALRRPVGMAANSCRTATSARRFARVRAHARRPPRRRFDRGSRRDRERPCFQTRRPTFWKQYA